MKKTTEKNHKDPGGLIPLFVFFFLFFGVMCRHSMLVMQTDPSGEISVYSVMITAKGEYLRQRPDGSDYRILIEAANKTANTYAKDYLYAVKEPVVTRMPSSWFNLETKRPDP